MAHIGNQEIKPEKVKPCKGEIYGRGVEPTEV